MSRDRYTSEISHESDEYEIRDHGKRDEFDRPLVIGSLKSCEEAGALVIALNNPTGGYSYDHSRYEGRATIAILDSVDNIVAHFHPADEETVQDLTARLNGECES